ncbi:MAG: 3-dehydroquinate synthase [Bacteroidaceae bacterium]|nr:3-dehydroquinate synthase [Bacteroidaceae bacterium]
MERKEVILSEHLEGSLEDAIGRCSHDRLFVLCDTTTLQLCWPLLAPMRCMAGAQTITIGATDEHKTLESLSAVWTALQQGGATRHSLMVNLGGGMVTDLGGFAASTFKRGIQYINIPTTLLSMVDASVGGKTGINFGGLKNEIGVFNCAASVIIDTQFLRTLDHQNLLSGYAEMLKHGLISDEPTWAELMRFPLDDIDYGHLQRMVARSVAVKERIVDADPLEHGIRRALNLGHTVGHAFESMALAQERTVLHGYAVAWGLVCELYLSTRRAGFPRDKFYQTIQFVRDHYGRFPFDCNDYPRLFELMTHDKKNTSGRINFTLLGDLGDIRIDQTATREEIMDMLDFYREY